MQQHWAPWPQKRRASRRPRRRGARALPQLAAEGRGRAHRWHRLAALTAATPCRRRRRPSFHPAALLECTNPSCQPARFSMRQCSCMPLRVSSSALNACLLRGLMPVHAPVVTVQGQHLHLHLLSQPVCAGSEVANSRAASQQGMQGPGLSHLQADPFFGPGQAGSSAWAPPRRGAKSAGDGLLGGFGCSPTTPFSPLMHAHSSANAF
jgi:hypothetical protein